MMAHHNSRNVKKIINCVRKHPYVWDSSLRVENKSELINAAWAEIASELNDTGKNIIL